MVSWSGRSLAAMKRIATESKSPQVALENTPMA